MDDIIEYRLLNSPPDVVYEIFKRHYKWQYSSILGKDIDSLEEYDYANLSFDKAEEKLLELDHPLVNLALAEYGSNTNVVNVLFQKPFSKAIRYAALKNSHYISSKTNIWLPDDRDKFLDHFLNDLSIEEKIILFQNRGLHNWIVDELYQQNGIFNDIESSEWFTLIYCTSKNPSIDYYIDSAGSSAWKLLEKLPATDEWAEVLFKLLKNIRPPHGLPYKHFLKKWVDVKDSNVDESYFLPLRALFIDNCYPDVDYIDYKNSCDKALRCFYYERFICRSLK